MSTQRHFDWKRFGEAVLIIGCVLIRATVKALIHTYVYSHRHCNVNILYSKLIVFTGRYSDDKNLNDNQLVGSFNVHTYNKIQEKMTMYRYIRTKNDDKEQHWSIVKGASEKLLCQ